MALLLHRADLLFDIGLFAVMLGGAFLLLVFLASHAHRRTRGHPFVAEGVNRAQRRKETVEMKRRRR